MRLRENYPFYPCLVSTFWLGLGRRIMVLRPSGTLSGGSYHTPAPRPGDQARGVVLKPSEFGGSDTHKTKGIQPAPHVLTAEENLRLLYDTDAADEMSVPSPIASNPKA